MFEGHRIAVVVPAFREEMLIRRTLDSIPAFVDVVIVVDDASDDRTSEAAASCRDPRLHLIRHATNRGVGAAIASGYAEAFDTIAPAIDIAVVVAGDAQMDPRDMTALLEPLTHGDADYAKGNRLSWPGVSRMMPTARFLGNLFFSVATRVATGLSIGDSQCGYTAISREAASRLPLDELWPRYGYPNDLLGHAALANLRVVDVPVRPVYADEKSGIGLRHALFVVPWVLVRVVVRRIFARPTDALLPARTAR